MPLPPLAWREDFSKTAQETLEILDDSIIRMGATGRMWRHVDGSLMAIPGALEVDHDMFEQVLLRPGQTARSRTMPATAALSGWPVADQFC